VSIPNIRSSSYQTNRNAYENAQAARTVAISSAESALASARATLAASQAQFTQATAPANSEDIALGAAQVAAARASLVAAQTRLSDSILVAPFSGIVTDVAVEPSELAGPSSPAVTVISDSAYQVTVDVPEDDIANIDVGDEAEVTFDAYDDNVFKATVAFVSPVARNINGVNAVEVKLAFLDDDPRVKSGFSADADISTAFKKDVLAVPARAIVEEDDRKYVRSLAADGSLKEIPVETGLRGSDGMVEITKGLQEGDTVITFIDQATLDALTSAKSK
jgi:HlyD family secretion protein